MTSARGPVSPAGGSALEPRCSRELRVVRGSAQETRAAALSIISRLGERALWVSADREAAGHLWARPREVQRQLGAGLDAAVISLHDGLDLDLLGQCEGMIWRGGTLVLRMPPSTAAPPRDASLAIWPFTLDDVGTRTWERFERLLAELGPGGSAEPATPARRAAEGTSEQAEVVARLARGLVDTRPTLFSLTAARGRGKSAALGLAVRAALEERALTVVIAAETADEANRFARGGASEDHIQLVPISELARCEPRADVIVIDEAARHPLALLELIVRRHPLARIAMATTTHGYEGTGRGFVLRFLEWARNEPRGLVELRLTEPIRFDADDLLERFVARALVLDAELTPIVSQRASAAQPVPHLVPRAELAANEARLRDVLGLLSHAHYRTTPSDLQRILDAPNLALHTLERDRVIGASLVAVEGGLPAEICERMARGEHRVHGHALADTLVAHAGEVTAGQLRLVRSVRIATHPALRRQGLARALVEHVHRHYAPDAFGTMFGASLDLLRFRGALGYELVRVGVSRGERSGEPALVMLRPTSPRARELVGRLRESLARNLGFQLALLRADGELLFDDGLERALLAGLPPAVALHHVELEAELARYVSGVRPFDALAGDARAFLAEHPAALARLDRRAQALIRGRALDLQGWKALAARAGFSNVAAAMRALRPAWRALLDLVREPGR